MMRLQNYKKYSDASYPCVTQTFADVTKALRVTINDTI